MTKTLRDKFNHLLDGRTLHFQTSDLSPETKTKLLDYLKPMGFTQSTFYLRFFDKGFDQWEIHGIEQVRRTFAANHKKELLTNKADGTVSESEEKGYAAVLMLNMDDNDGSFYTALRHASLIGVFQEYMKELGMGRNTVLTRFTAENWKLWELRGLKNILKDFIDQYGEQSE